MAATGDVLPNLLGELWPCASVARCYNPRSSSSYILMFPREASKRLFAGGYVSRRLRISPSECVCAASETPALGTCNRRERVGAFTLLELLIVVGIIAVLLVLIAPAFTNIKSGGDVASAAYTIKGVLDTARTYAKANNTYTWVGFFEEDISNPPNAGTGRLVMSIVASKDGTAIYDPANLAQQDLTTNVTQVGKLTKIDNVHLWTHTDTPLGTGSNFDTRTYVPSTYCIGDTSPSNSTTPFQYPVGNPAPAPQYQFFKAVQFNPRGEAQINNSTVGANGVLVYPPQRLAEIGLEPTHGNVAPASMPGNVVAVQFTGLGGDVTIYRR